MDLEEKKGLFESQQENEIELDDNEKEDEQDKIGANEYEGVGTDREILTHFDDNLHSLANTGDREWRDLDVIDGFRLMAGWQWDDNSISKLRKEGRQPISINLFHSLVNGVAGLFEQNKREIKYYPVNAEDSDYSMAVEKANKWVRDQGRFGSIEMQMIKHLLVCGIGCVYETVDYQENPDGKIKLQLVNPRNIAWDQSARETNLKDANWIVMCEMLSKRELYARFPEHAAAIIAASKSPEEPFLYGGEGISSRGSFCHQSRLNMFNYENTTSRDEYPVYYYQYKRNKKYLRLDNPLMKPEYAYLFEDVLVMPDMGGIPGAMPEDLGLMPGMQPQPSQAKLTIDALVQQLGLDQKAKTWQVPYEQQQLILDNLAALGISVDRSERTITVCYQATIGADKVLHKSECPDPTRFNFKFVTGYYDESKKNWYCFARLLRYPQRALNAALLKLWEALNTLPKGGLVVESDAVDDMNAFILEYMRPNGVAVVNPGGTAKLSQKFESNGSAAFESILAYLGNAFSQITGINKELFGTTDVATMSAKLNMEMTRQSMASVATLFQSFGEYLQDIGFLTLSFLRELAENNPNRLIRIFDDEELSTKYIELSKDKLAGEYDVEIIDAPLSGSQKENTFRQLVDLLSSGMIPQEQQPILVSVMMDYAQIPPEAMKKLKEAQAKAEENQQLQLQQQQLTPEQQQQLDQAKQILDQQAQATQLESLRNMALQNDALELSNKNQQLELLKKQAEIEQIRAATAEKQSSSSLKDAQTVNALAAAGEKVSMPMHHIQEPFHQQY